MVSQAMVFIARRFLIYAALQFVVITRYYASLCLAKNKNQRTLNSVQLRFLGSKFIRQAVLRICAAHTGFAILKPGKLT
jgi:hypothetical protein